MNLLEKEIIEKFRQLDPAARKRLLGLLEHIEYERPLSALELMRLPAEERQRRVQAAIASAVDEDFETFEAYSEEAIND
ncbi:MAG: hypothetical protein EA396_15160 [Anaerolineaceae bacterium]|nr:MAG: hypothetical protein EA396_15160 [Anaerolineaceae bacterium]